MGGQDLAWLTPAAERKLISMAKRPCLLCVKVNENDASFCRSHFFESLLMGQVGTDSKGRDGRESRHQGSGRSGVACRKVAA